MKSFRSITAMVAFFVGASPMPVFGTSNTVDYAQRNEPFAVEPTIRPEVRAKEQAESLQTHRVDYPAMPMKPASVADRRSPLAVSEPRPKTVLPAVAQQPAVRTLPMNTLAHRVSSFDTKDRMASPPLVTKYQDSLRCATAINPGRYPVIEKQGLFARLNRFVFQRNRTPVTDAPVVSVNARKSAQP